MKELRCIVFSDNEMVAAISDRRKRLNESMPNGNITGIRYAQEGGLSASLIINSGEAEAKIGEEELQAALVAHCMQKNVPLPVEADKALYIIKSHVTLMITMNFRKPARTVARAAG